EGLAPGPGGWGDRTAVTKWERSPYSTSSLPALMNFSGFGVWPFPGVWPVAGATPPNVKPANAAPLLRNPRRSDFMGLSFADEPGKQSLPIVASIGERPQPQITFVLASSTLARATRAKIEHASAPSVRRRPRGRRRWQWA